MSGTILIISNSGAFVERRAPLALYLGGDGTIDNGSTSNLDLAQNPFYSDFTDPITLTDGAKTLPGMQGSGMVRDLQQAASLDGALVSDIAALAGTTRAQMMNALDGLIERWAATSTMPTSLQSAAANGFALTYLVPGMSVADYWAIRGLDGGSVTGGTSGGGSSGGGSVVIPSEAERTRLENLRAQQQALVDRISVLGQGCAQFKQSVYGCENDESWRKVA